MENKKIVIPGGAGLVGQNLVVQLKKLGYRNLVVIDKHRANLAILKKLHSDIVIEQADLAEPEQWEMHFKNADTVIMLQAQIGAPTLNPFVRNNIETTKHILELIKQYKVPYTVHISSSVVESVADDYYTQTKKKQEDLVLNRGIPCIVLRPTLMFGWLDRKHLGWLSRLMKKSPLFPILEQHIVSVPFYMPAEHPKFSDENGIFMDKVHHYLKMINPELNDEDFSDIRASRYRCAQPICPPNYLASLPPYESSIKRLWIADTSYYYPEDRGISESIGFGRKMARESIATLLKENSI